MQHDVLLTKTAGNGYVARPLLWPEIVVSGENEADAIAQVRNALAAALDQSHVIQIELPEANETDNPWLRAAGMWKDIPEEMWNSFQSGVEMARQAANREGEFSQTTDAD